MRKRIQAGWIILIWMMLSLTITACVRPHPDSQVSADESTTVPVVTQPAFITQVPPSTTEPSLVTPEPTNVPDPTPVGVVPTAESATETTYIVIAGDTLFKIAIEHDVTVDDIAAANGILDIDSLEIGQELKIPAPGTDDVVETEDPEPDPDDETGTESGTESPAPDEVPTTSPSASSGVHVVRPGDNLYRIGLQYGCSVEQLSSHNGLTNPNRISVGMEIQIPDCN